MASAASVHIVKGATACMPYSSCITARSPSDLASNSVKSVSAISNPPFFALAHLAQRFFLDAAGAGPALQFAHHVRRRQAEMRERDHAVEPQVGDLADDLRAVAAM